MAYFSNGTEGMSYFEEYCSRCIFDKGQNCPIWMLHMIHNYEECNKPESFLHALIPRSKDKLGNEECFFFRPEPSIGLPLELRGCPTCEDGECAIHPSSSGKPRAES